MSVLKKVLLFFILPILGVFSFDPSLLSGGFTLIAVVAFFFGIIGFFLWQGYTRVLTFAIFLNGMNVIVRLMLLLSGSFNKDGVFQPVTTLFILIGFAISFYLMLRLDKVDVRLTMTK